MTYYRITAIPKGPMATPLISGTIWGHLAWAIRYLEGETALHAWLEEQDHNPWLFSSQMPKGMLPKPQLQPITATDGIDSLEIMDRRKRIRKIGYIPETVFLGARKAMNETALFESTWAEYGTADPGDEVFLPVRLAHNRIDRQTGRTPDEGGLFFEKAQMPFSGTELQIFAYCPTPCGERLQTLLDHIGNNGFGANASTGCGAIHFELREETALFGDGGNRAMSLSHGVLSANMSAVRYRQHVHFGKLGGHYAVGAHSPFKYPILMMQPGATFHTLGDGPFGALLKKVHHSQDLQGVRHHALHLPVYFTEAAA